MSISSKRKPVTIVICSNVDTSFSIFWNWFEFPVYFLPRPPLIHKPHRWFSLLTYLLSRHCMKGLEVSVTPLMLNQHFIAVCTCLVSRLKEVPSDSIVSSNNIVVNSLGLFFISRSTSLILAETRDQINFSE